MRQTKFVAFAGLAMLLSQISAMASESNEAMIEDTYNAWVQTTNTRDMEQWAAYLAADALFLPPGSKPLQSTDEIKDYYRRSFADPHFSLDCRQLGVDVAKSGEMAWARGVCQATFTGPDGQKASANSRWVKVWSKQDDGSWKCRVNTWNYEDE